MTILVSHFFSKENKGDAAILSVLLATLKKKFASANLHVLTTRYAARGEHFEGVPVTNVLYYWGNSLIMRRLKSFYVIFVSSIYAILYRLLEIKFLFILDSDLRELVHLYEKSDIVIPTGGGYLTARNDLQGNLHIIQQAHIIYLARLFKKQIILYPQSIGPLGNWFQKLIIKFTLNRVDSIFVRERISLKVLEELGVTKPKVEFAPDLAFGFVSDKKQAMNEHLKELGIDFSKPVTGITVRNWLDKSGQDKYEKTIAEFADWLIAEKDMQVVFVPQVTSALHNDDDREVQKRILPLMKVKQGIWSLEKDYDHYEIKGIYENMNYVVGTRMHSVIFALTGNVPAIAIAYEPKTLGIMRELGLQEWVVHIEGLSKENLTNMFEKLIKQNQSP